jgi:hypothetical protein
MTTYESAQTSGSLRIPRAVRSIAAIVAGLAAVAIPSIAVDALLHSTGIYPPLDQPQPAYTLVIALAYRTVFTVFGGYVAAWIAGYRPVTHGAVLGAIGMVLGTIGAVTMWHIGNQWYPIALVVLAIPSTWLGARLFARR